MTKKCPQGRGFLWSPGLPILKNQRVVNLFFQVIPGNIFFYHKYAVKHILGLTNPQFIEKISSQAIGLNDFKCQEPLQSSTITYVSSIHSLQK